MISPSSWPSLPLHCLLPSNQLHWCLRRGSPQSLAIPCAHITCCFHLLVFAQTVSTTRGGRYFLSETYFQKFCLTNPSTFPAWHLQMLMCLGWAMYVFTWLSCWYSWPIGNDNIKNDYYLRADKCQDIHLLKRQRHREGNPLRILRGSDWRVSINTPSIP